MIVSMNNLVRRSTMFRAFLITAIMTLFTATGHVTAHARSGGLDSKGCHHDRKHGGYHCHR
jgi:hypothetical protein